VTTNDWRGTVTKLTEQCIVVQTYNGATVYQAPINIWWISSKLMLAEGATAPVAATHLTVGSGSNPGGGTRGKMADAADVAADKKGIIEEDNKATPHALDQFLKE